jgi:hypothetical protein
MPEEMIAEVLARALSATTTTRSGITEPDHKCRLQAVSIALSYTEGKPIERQQILSHTIAADPVADIEARLAKSPALRASLAATLAKIEENKAVV